MSQEQHSEQSYSPGFSDFTLAELTLLQQGLQAIGRQDAVDPRLVPNWRGLEARLRSAIQVKVAEQIEGGSRFGLAEEAKAASARCRDLAERVAFHGVKHGRTLTQEDWSA